MMPDPDSKSRAPDGPEDVLELLGGIAQDIAAEQAATRFKNGEDYSIFAAARTAHRLGKLVDAHAPSILLYNEYLLLGSQLFEAIKRLNQLNAYSSQIDSPIASSGSGMAQGKSRPK